MTNHTPATVKLLKRIEQLFDELDEATRGQTDPPEFPESPLFQLQVLIRELEFTKDPVLEKCARLADHIRPGMTRRHFLNLLIPIERALGRQVKDSDFLVTDTDQSKDCPTALAGAPGKADFGPLEKVLMVFVLENLRSAFNVGSILRLADGLGVTTVYTTGYTAGSESEAVQKTALGADRHLQILSFENSVDAIAQLKNQGYRIVGLETAKTATPLFSAQLQEKTAWIVGNERFGIEPATLKLCDELVILPLRGFKNSLNVATALTAAAFEWTRQFGKTSLPPAAPPDFQI